MSNTSQNSKTNLECWTDYKVAVTGSQQIERTGRKRCLKRESQLQCIDLVTIKIQIIK